MGHGNFKHACQLKAQNIPLLHLNEGSRDSEKSRFLEADSHVSNNTEEAGTGCSKSILQKGLFF